MWSIAFEDDKLESQKVKINYDLCTNCMVGCSWQSWCSPPRFFTSALKVRDCSELFYHAVDVIERNSFRIGSNSESLGTLCVDTNFVFRGAACTPTSVALIFREREILYSDVPSVLETCVVLRKSISIQAGMCCFLPPNFYDFHKVINTVSHVLIAAVPICFAMKEDSAHTAVPSLILLIGVYSQLGPSRYWNLSQHALGQRQEYTQGR